MPLFQRNTLLTAALAGLTLLLVTGCTPQYPKCDKDEHCKEGEFCVNGMCQQCREDKDCPEGQVCKEGRCEKPEGYCDTSDDCPNGGACKDHRCVTCETDADCGEGWTCKNGKCLKPGQCFTDEDCPENHECQNGVCVGPPSDTGAAKCTPQPVYFDFDEFVLTSDATQKLQQAAECIKSVENRTVRLEGHADPRGTEEYNLALGDRRAQSVKRYLVRLGIPETRMRAVSKGKLEATGSEESGWVRDRRVEFIWE